MSLETLLKISGEKENTNKGVSEERLRACLPEMRKAIAFYRVYPDIFVDDIKGPECVFKFYTYQRVFLRAVMRHKWTYCTFPRA